MSVSLGTLPRLRAASLLAFVPVAKAAKRNLCDLYAHESRHYHGIDHIVQLWDRHDRFAPGAGLDDPACRRLIASAIAYHDAIYDGHRSDNELRSAELWCEDSARSAIDPAERALVADIIRATADHLGYRPEIDVADERLARDERAIFWMLDLDLTPLGETAALFDANAELLRLEDAERSDDAHAKAERAFLTRIVAAPRIYRSPVLAANFEIAARRNLERRLATA